jgi:hypothetical protein
MNTRDEVHECLQYSIDWVKSQVHVQHPDGTNCVRIILSDRTSEDVGTNGILYADRTVSSTNILMLVHMNKLM